MDKNQADPILEEDLLADIDLEIDAVIKEEIKKATYKTKPVKLDMSDINWEHKTMNKSYNYTYEESMSHKVTEQINGLWQKIKTMESNLKYYSDALELQNKIIRNLEEQIEAQQNDNIVEINDRLDDIESKLNLIDE